MREGEFLNLSHEDLAQYLESSCEKSYRASQVFEWIYKKGVNSFEDMKNLSNSLREKLSQDFIMENIVETPRRGVSTDGTTKFLFTLKDDEKIETVLIPASKRATVCVSSQVGCKYGCKFCASGIGGLKRNLTTAEILGQILKVKQYVETPHWGVSTKDKKSITHIVFMGVGEPLDTVKYDRLSTFWRGFTSRN